MVTDEKRAALAEKIRKLRALSTSSNVHEAAIAAAKVEKLIQEHNFAEAELEVDNTAEVHEACSEDPDFVYQWDGNKVKWTLGLTFHLVDQYQCECIVIHKGVRVTGRPSDVATVRYMFAWLTTEIKRLSAASRLRGKAARTSFCIGAVDGIILAMRKTAQEARITATSNALAVIDNRAQLAKEVVNQLYPKTIKVSASSAIRNSDAYYDGKRAGERIHTGAHLDSGGNPVKRLT